MKENLPKIYFSDLFEVNHSLIEDYGALDISIVCDNPAFVDPFLIFANPKYKQLHDQIINYLSFLRDKSHYSTKSKLSSVQYQKFYCFPEIKQVWLGYSVAGNAGQGLGIKFAQSLDKNLRKIFDNFGGEEITESAHIEKLCLIEEGIGVDKISDFTLNLIKDYLFEYTQTFAKKYLKSEYVKKFAVRKAVFNKNNMWEDRMYELPIIKHQDKLDYVLLVPKDILTRHDTWISKNDFLSKGTDIFTTVENEELRQDLNKFFQENLDVKMNTKNKVIKDHSRKSKTRAFLNTVENFPEVLDYYIAHKENKSHEALANPINPEDINFYFDTEKVQKIFSNQKLLPLNSVEDCLARLRFFKSVLESNSSSLYIKSKKLHEKQLQLMFKMLTYDSLFDYNSEVNNGRGPIDFIVSYGKNDKIGIEFKMASNTKLKNNLLNQTQIYKDDSNLELVVKVIFYFSDSEEKKIRDILNAIKKKEDCKEIFLIDCRKKKSASNFK